MRERGMRLVEQPELRAEVGTGIAESVERIAHAVVIACLSRAGERRIQRIARFGEAIEMGKRDAARP